jgi:hypothetical protein
MIKKAIIFVFLGLVIGCAPGTIGGESWGKAMFSPSSVSDQAACDAGFEFGQTQKKLNSVGALRFQTSKGLVLFNTRLSKLYFLCNSLGWLNGRKPSSFSPVFSSDIMFDDAAMVGKTAQVTISLEDEQGKEFARLNATKDETEGNRQWYTPISYSNADIAALNLAKSFTIIINRGTTDERYKVNSSFTPLSPVQEIPAMGYIEFNPEVRKVLREAN